MYKRNPYVETGGGGRGDVDVGIYLKLTSCATMKMTTMNFIVYKVKASPAHFLPHCKYVKIENSLTLYSKKR